MAKEIKNQEIVPRETPDIKIKPTDDINKTKADNI